MSVAPRPGIIDHGPVRGASASADGVQGDVPTPVAGDQEKVLCGDGTWKAAGTPIASAIHAATAKNTPADDDELGLIDSAAAWVLKKLTWAKLRDAIFGQSSAYSPTFSAPNFTVGYKINGAAAEGTFARGNGANYVASTLTLPNSATANRIPYATGANAWGESANLTFNGTSLNVGGAGGGAAIEAASSNAVASNFFVTDTRSFAANVGGQFYFRGKYNAAGAYALFGALRAVKENSTDGNTAGYLRLDTNNGTGLNNSVEQWRISSTGSLSNTSATGTAAIHLKAGTATANTAPLKFTAGTNLTTPENGAFEFDGTNLYFTVGGVRKTVTLT
jgi:hypothetical protein